MTSPFKEGRQADKGGRWDTLERQNKYLYLKFFLKKIVTYSLA